jgi:hypothetical protein
VDPVVYLLLVLTGALALVTMFMIQQQLNRASTAAELDAQMSPVSDDEEVVIELPPPDVNLAPPPVSEIQIPDGRPDDLLRLAH